MEKILMGPPKEFPGFLGRPGSQMENRWGPLGLPLPGPKGPKGLKPLGGNSQRNWLPGAKTRGRGFFPWEINPPFFLG